MKKKLILSLTLFPLVSFAWSAQCSFVVQSAKKLNRGTIGNLIILNCKDISSDLPNYQWLQKSCATYTTTQYPVALVGGDSSLSECQQGLTNQSILVYQQGNVYASKRKTPGSFQHKPVVIQFPKDF